MTGNGGARTLYIGILRDVLVESGCECEGMG